MTRTIRTAAELDALPVGSVVRNLSRGITAERLADGRGVIPGNPTACPWDSLWSAGSHIVVLYDPSAPAPAPSVVPEAAVERAARAMQAENAPKPDPLNRDQREEQDDATIATYRTLARAALTAALPLLTAAPSATREAVEAVIFEADDECVLEVHEVRSLASRLLARFTITPKEDR